jgi:hypothetical protein
MSLDNFSWLEEWYQKRCNGEWEHSFGISISTLDNPGWKVRIDLDGTPYAALPDVEITERYDSDSEWMLCKVVEGVYEGTGGPLMLGPIVQTFRKWIEEF